MEACSPLRNPLCVALDVDSESEAMALVSHLGPLVGGFKIGPRLAYQGGKSFLQKVAKVAPVFVDCKFFDIPSTMEAAVRASFDAGASLVTVHAMAGEEALSQMAKLEMEFSKERPFRILAVTILTSWKESSLPSNLRQLPIPEHVRQLAELVKRAGLRSIVCSAEEIGILKDLSLYMVTPGIRFARDPNSDQKRVVEPKEAMLRGSSALVVGRPIIEAPRPVQAAEDYLKAINLNETLS